MKQFTIIFLAAAILITAFFLLSPPPSGDSSVTLPWQIEAHDDGTSTIFGITLGATTFSRAGEILGINREVAVLVDSDDRASLEMYYGYFRSGPLAGKLIISADASPQLAAQIAKQSGNGEFLGTGSRRFNLELHHLGDEKLLVNSIVFIPSSNLDAEVIMGRFGEPEQLITAAESQHYLYPAKGLDVVLNEEGKETLQYVAPGNFERLRQPLQKFLAEQ